MSSHSVYAYDTHNDTLNIYASTFDCYFHAEFSSVSKGNVCTGKLVRYKREEHLGIDVRVRIKKCKTTPEFFTQIFSRPLSALTITLIIFNLTTLCLDDTK